MFKHRFTQFLKTCLLFTHYLRTCLHDIRRHIYSIGKERSFPQKIKNTEKCSNAKKLRTAEPQQNYLVLIIKKERTPIVFL